MSQKVIFDTDPGIDDALALLYLHACPSLDLTAITTTLGNASLDDCTANALFLCEGNGIRHRTTFSRSDVFTGVCHRP